MRNAQFLENIGQREGVEPHKVSSVLTIFVCDCSSPNVFKLQSVCIPAIRS